MAKGTRPEGGKKFEYDPTFRGPLHKRSCTDIICLLLWVAFIAAWIAIGCFALVNGDIERYLHPKNSAGLKCGVDKSVEQKPYLMLFDVTKCASGITQLKSFSRMVDNCPTTKVCASNCPEKVFVYNEKLTYNDVINDLYCTSGIKEKLHSTDDIKTAIGNGECASWYLPSMKVGRRCLPSVVNSTVLNQVGIKTSEALISTDILSNVTEIGETIIRNLEGNWPWMVGFLAIAEVLSLIYILLMQWIAGVMVWLSLFAGIGLNAVCIYLCYAKYAELRDAPSENHSEALFANRDTWLVLLIISSIVLVIVLIIILFLRKRIVIAIALIEEASRAVGSLKSTLLYPLFSWILQCVVIAWAILVGLSLLSCKEGNYTITKTNNTAECEDYVDGGNCEPFNFDKNCGSCNEAFKYQAYVTYFHIVNIFGFLWGMCFVSGLSQMILAGAYATWYWTFKKSNVPFFATLASVGRTVRYHLGTVAFGSLILAICKFIRLVLEYINHKLSKFDNCLVKVLMCCLRCFFWCLEKFIKFINKNAYIMCAIHGKNFCRSARTAFNLILRNILRAAVLDKVTDFLLFLGKLTITGAMMALSFYIFSKDNKATDEYILVPVFIVGIGTYFIASICFGVYSMAVDTIFLCFLEDLERNDGSTEKPYFMSKNLMSILGKKNKKNKQKEK